MLESSPAVRRGCPPALVSLERSFAAIGLRGLLGSADFLFSVRSLEAEVSTPLPLYLLSSVSAVFSLLLNEGK